MLARSNRETRDVFCQKCGKEMEYTPDGDYLCLGCGHELQVWTIGDLSYRWDPGKVWIYCPNCQSSEADGIYATIERRPRACWICGLELMVDQDRKN